MFIGNLGVRVESTWQSINVFQALFSNQAVDMSKAIHVPHWVCRHIAETCFLI